MNRALRIVCCLAGLLGFLLQPVAAVQFGAGSGTSYPSGLDTTNTRTNKGGGACSSATTTFICAEWLNDHQSATAAIEAELGAAPKGSSASVKERIAGIRSLAGATADVITISGGNVGIGTTSPANKLAVSGAVSTDLAAFVNGGYSYSGANQRGVAVIGVNSRNGTTVTFPAGNYDVTGGLFGARGMTGGSYGVEGMWTYVDSIDGTGFGYRTQVTGAGTNNYGLYIDSVTSATNNYGVYIADTSAKNYFGGNVGIGTTTFGTSAAKVLGIGNGTAPTSSPANMVQVWAESISSSSELRVRDQAGNVTTLSPHSADILNALPHTSPFPWIYRSSNDYLGQSVWVDMSAVVAAVEQLTGKTFAHYAAIPRRDWDADQAEARSTRNAEIIAVQDRKREKELAREKATDDDARQKLDEEIQNIIIPEPYREQPMPRWMQHRLQPDSTPTPQQPSKGGRS